MEFVTKALQLILSFSILIFVHELGHFGFSRLFGIRVDKFYLFFNPKFSIVRFKKINGRYSVKFFSKNLPPHVVAAIDENGIPKTDKRGKPIMLPATIDQLSDDDWRKYPDTTEWGIGWIPFGGYCKIAGMVDESMDRSLAFSAPQKWEYRSRPAWQRLFVIVGGVLFNFIFAIIVFAMLLFKNGETTLPLPNATMGYNYCQTAINNGFENGDRIIAINNFGVDSKQEVVNRLVIDGDTDVKVVRGADTVSIVLPKNFGEQIVEANENPFMQERFPFVIDYFVAEPTKQNSSLLSKLFGAKKENVQVGLVSPAQKAGLEKGDSIIGVNGKIMNDFMDIKKEFLNNAGKTVVLSIYRRGSLMEKSVPLDSSATIGVVPVVDISKFFEVEKTEYSFFESFPAGVATGLRTLVGYVKQFKLVFTKAGAKSIGGVGSFGNLFPGQWNWTIFWTMTALISVILAFMNILPIPILDGGYILFIIYEMITGKQPNDKFMDVSLNIGLFLLIALMIYANGNDLFRFVLHLMSR